MPRKNCTKEQRQGRKAMDEDKNNKRNRKEQEEVKKKMNSESRTKTGKQKESKKKCITVCVVFLLTILQAFCYVGLIITL
jgi:hypothetical protein